MQEALCGEDFFCRPMVVLMKKKKVLCLVSTSTFLGIDAGIRCTVGNGKICARTPRTIPEMT